MPAASAALPWPRWHDLPSDLLRDISGRLLAVADYIRFHAVCKPWRYSVPPAERRPTFPPWLLAPPDDPAAAGHQKTHRVFSYSRNSGSTWVIRAADGVAYLLVAAAGNQPSGILIDPLTGSNIAATLPPFPDEIAAWVNRADATAGVISGDGTIVLYAFCPPALDSNGRSQVTYITAARNNRIFNVALLRPGDSAAGWTPVDSAMCVSSPPWDMESCSVAYNNGWIIVCCGRTFLRIRPAQLHEAHTTFSGCERWIYWSMLDLEEQVQSSYLVESHGELLLACVEIDNSYWKSWDCIGDIIDLVKALSVSVYVLQQEEQGVRGTPRWVKRDGRSFLTERVLFLGRPSSFAVDAAQLGMNGGCAYFLDKRQLYYQANMGRNWCRLLKYSFSDGRSEFVEEQPAEWTCKAGMWITPQPVIAASTVT
ncbi:unnamed protein product [Urochloa humidicola]